MADGYCSCGIALEDPLHYGFHRIMGWNESVRADAVKKSEKEFEKRLPKKKEKSWTSLDI